MEVSHKWSLLKYFDKYNYTQHQISSYNIFISSGIQDIINNEPDIFIENDVIKHRVNSTSFHFET